MSKGSFTAEIGTSLQSSNMGWQKARDVLRVRALDQCQRYLFGVIFEGPLTEHVKITRRADLGGIWEG